MRQRTNASETFTTALLDSSDAQNAALVKERDGVRSGLGWNNRSWERRKRLEQAEQMRAQEERRLLNDERRRMTPLGRMENSSLSVWNSIASPKFERVIMSSYTSLLAFAEDSQLNSNLESMSYEQLLSGMLFPGEALQYIPPARIKTFRKVAKGGKVLEEKSTLRAFFTDKRLFFIHTEFSQSPTVNYSSTKGSPLTRVKLKLSCDLADNMFWTAVNLEKVLAQTIDCEYKASTATTVIITRPRWGMWTVVLGVIMGLAVAFMPQDNVQNLIGVSVLSLVLVVVGAWVLLTQRQYRTEDSGTDSTRSRKILIGLDDPVFMDLVTLDCELEEDYALADAFEFIQGMRSVARQLRGDVVAGAFLLASRLPVDVPSFAHMVLRDILGGRLTEADRPDVVCAFLLMQMVTSCSTLMLSHPRTASNWRMRVWKAWMRIPSRNSKRKESLCVKSLMRRS
jgi:hypothetical protein